MIVRVWVIGSFERGLVGLVERILKGFGGCDGYGVGC